MRAGKLDRSIVLQRATETVGSGGAVSRGWATVGELRAELVNVASVETATLFGEEGTATLMLRTRYLDGLTTADRVAFGGSFYNIKAITEIGRRRGLELRIERDQ